MNDRSRSHSSSSASPDDMASNNVLAKKGIEENEEERDTWGNSWSFTLAALGAAIGLGAVARFPFLTFRHGGAAFLLPYLFFLFILGLPLLALEFMLGQRMRVGPVGTFAKIHPRAWGVGLWACAASWLIMVGYNIIMAWAWIFLANSFQSELPWGTNFETAQRFFLDVVQGHREDCAVNLECGVGSFQWQLALALLVQYVVVFLAISKGTKLVSKVVWFTVPAPIIILLVLLCYSLTLEGSSLGIHAYIGRLEVSALSDGNTWVDAAGQIFYGLSVACGPMIAYGSGQKINRSMNFPAWFVAVGNSVFSFIAGFAMFGVMGYLANDLGVSVMDMTDFVGGFQLTFVSFPVAIALLPSGVSHFFAVIFFLFLLFLGVDSSMALAESCTVTMRDHIPFLRHRPALTAGLVCLSTFLFGLIMCTEGGESIMDILDHYTSNYCVLLVGVFECLSVWVYEYQGDGKKAPKDRTWRDIVFSSKLEREMTKITGKSVKWLPFAWSFLVKFVAPILITGLFAIMVYEDSVEIYGGYPIWATAVFGWLMCVIIPIGMVLAATLFPMNLNHELVGDISGDSDDGEFAEDLVDGKKPAMERQNSVMV